MASQARTRTPCRLSSRPQFAQISSSMLELTRCSCGMMLTRRQDCPHRNGKEQEAAIRSEREGGSSDECGVLGYRYVNTQEMDLDMEALRRYSITNTNTFLNQAALSHVSPVSAEEVPTAPAKQPSATNVALAACSHPPKSGANGTKRSISARSASPPHPPSPPPHPLRSSSPAATTSPASQRYPSSSPALPSAAAPSARLPLP